MQTYKYPDRETWAEIAQRPSNPSAGMDKVVGKILKKVKAQGDRAVRKFTREFDGVSIKKLAVDEKEWNTAGSKLSEELKMAIELARKNIAAFHHSQKENLIKTEILPGITCWRKQVAIETVGLYIPAGSAPLFSTVLMLGLPAQLAGCTNIILCTPPMKDGKIHPAILYTAGLCGITKIFKTGGAQAIAAMAYGTESIPKVFKIFGPGNAYVTMAKQCVQMDGTAIDMPAGPSELLIIADQSANAEFVAADLLSQAEHGPDSQVILITTDQSFGDEVIISLGGLIDELPRKEIAREALMNSKLIVTRNMEEAVAISNYYAPEHLILACADAGTIADKIISAGSVFLGNYSPESAGDYASGTNHVLPTNGYAAAYSGVSLDSFMKKISFQELTKPGLESIASTIMIMAEGENLTGHKNAVAVRLKK